MTRTLSARHYSWLEDQEQQLFYNGIRTLEECWTKCISVAGDYAEK